MKEPESQIVSVTEARVLLGDAAAKLSDQEVRILIVSMDELAILLVEILKVQR